MTKVRQTPLTLEIFEKFLIPQLDAKFARLEKKIDHLPSKQAYFDREDKTMAELKKLREEVTMTSDLYTKTNKRVDKIDKHLNIDTAVVF